MLMPVANVHERLLPAPADRISRMLETLATVNDELWPAGWPQMRLDAGLREGSVGGHGPIRYEVTQVEAGRLVRFRFLAPRGLDGDHWFELVPRDDRSTLLRHGLVAKPSGAMRWQWPLLLRPLHDALIEDALARALAVSTDTEVTAKWSPRVRMLRRLARARR